MTALNVKVLTPGEVAAIFEVNTKTVTRWANQGKLPFIRTVGGHRRFREADVRGLLATRDEHAANVAAVAARLDEVCVGDGPAILRWLAEANPELVAEALAATVDA